MRTDPPEDEGPSEEDRGAALEGDPLLEQTVQLYHELRVRKRPPETPAGAHRKALRWLLEEAAHQGRPAEPGWSSWLQRAALDVEGDVAQAQARRRHTRRARPPGRTEATTDRTGRARPRR